MDTLDRVRRGLLASCLVFGLSTPVLAAEFETILLSGDPAPQIPGATLAEFTGFTVGPDGGILFSARMLNVAADEDTAVFLLGANGAERLIARKGGSIRADGKGSGLLSVGAGILADGGRGFFGGTRIAGNGSGTTRGDAYAFDSRPGYEPVLRRRDEIGSSGLFVRDRSSYDIGASYDVASVFAKRQARRRIVVRRFFDGRTEVIAGPNSVPGGPGSFFNAIEPPRLVQGTDLGAFEAALSGFDFGVPVDGNRALFAFGASGDPVLFWAPGDPATPDLPAGQVFRNIIQRQWDLAANGSYVVGAEAGVSRDDELAGLFLFRSDGSSERIAAKRDIIPGTGGLRLRRLPRSPLIDSGNAVSFLWEVEDRTVALFFKPDGEPTQVLAVEGQELSPGSGQTVTRLPFSIPKRQMNARGDRVFTATLSGPAGRQDALLGISPEGELEIIVATRELFPVGPGDLREVRDVDIGPVITESGETLLRIEFTDGSSGLFLATL